MLASLATSESRCWLASTLRYSTGMTFTNLWTVSFQPERTRQATALWVYSPEPLPAVRRVREPVAAVQLGCRRLKSQLNSHLAGVLEHEH